MRKEKGEMVTDEAVHVGDMISIYWDGDRQWYNGKVLWYDGGSQECKVLYDDGEVEQTNLKETKYRIIRNRSKDAKKLILEDGETAIDDAELMKYMGKLVLDCEDRLPLEAVRVNSEVWWQDWRKETSAAAKSGDVHLLAVAVRKFSLQLKPNVTTAWWKSQIKGWRAALDSVNSSSELQASVKDLLTKAVDWAHARVLFSNAKAKRGLSNEGGNLSADAESGPRTKRRRLSGSGPAIDHVAEKLLGTSAEAGVSYADAEELSPRKMRRRLSGSGSVHDHIGEKFLGSPVEAGNLSADVEESGRRRKSRRLSRSGPDQVDEKLLGSSKSTGNALKGIQESHHEFAVKHVPSDKVQRFAELNVDCSSIKFEYASDGDFKNIYSLFSKDQSLLTTDQSASISGYSLQDGLLFMNERLCIVKDMVLRNQLIERCHSSSQNEHLTTDRTVDFIKSKYYWPELEIDVQNYISQCTLCQQQKQTIPATESLPERVQIPQTWETVIIKLLTGLPVSSEGYDSVFVVADTFSKQAHFLRCDHDFTPLKLAQLYFREVVRLHGVPKAMFCDNVLLFQNKSWGMLWESFGVTINFNSSQYTDVNQTLENLLRTHAASQQQQWSDSLHLVEFSYNNSSSTDSSCPFKVLHGYEMHAPWPFTMEAVKDENASKFVMHMTNFLKDIKQGLATVQQKTSSNPTACSGLFQVGDKVALRVSPGLFGAIISAYSNLYPCYFGPFEIKAVIDWETYEVDIPDSWKVSKCVDGSSIKPYCVTDDHIRVHEVQVEPESGGQIRLEPEQILGTRFKQIHESTVFEYLIQWRGSSSYRSTWESDVSSRWFSLGDFLSYQSG